ncbi:MAG: potassium channel family protein, partial [Muribaculaceae bacterium]|nr:potassium channel family protein [Muribaculaceae bacterium]
NALWWAAMDMTTVGSNIVAVTPVGMVLSVLLAALGMMLFPIFTVYVTNLIQGQQQRGWIIGQGNFLPEQDDNTPQSAGIASAPQRDSHPSSTEAQDPKQSPSE